jgi:hypothetical protein
MGPALIYENKPLWVDSPYLLAPGGTLLLVAL